MPVWPTSMPQEVQNFAFGGRRVPQRVQNADAPALSAAPVRVAPPHAVQNLLEAPCRMPQELHVTKSRLGGVVRVDGEMVAPVATALMVVPHLVQNLVVPGWTRPQDGHVR